MEIRGLRLTREELTDAICVWLNNERDIDISDMEITINVEFGTVSIDARDPEPEPPADAPLEPPSGESKI